MCWIMTMTTADLLSQSTKFTNLILDNSVFNRDGAAVVFLGDNPADDFSLRSMNIEKVIDSLLTLDCDGRIFVHLRMATTQYVGLGYTHGFDDLNNRFFMHNGIIRNEGHAVDSFGLVHGQDIAKETYANIFEIDADKRRYFVTRKSVGSLFTDGSGNFCTTQCDFFPIPVPVNSVFSQELPKATVYDIADYLDEEKYLYDDAKYAEEFDNYDDCKLKIGV